jgi:hypothetical protein
MKACHSEEKAMKKNNRTQPYFVRFLENQELAEVTAGMTLKYPSDTDEFAVTLKYPSDDDEDIIIVEA